MNPEIKRLQRLISKHTLAIDKIQKACPHPKETLVYENKSDTGNWCEQDDDYWAEYKCYECNRWWIGNQGEHEGIRKDSNQYIILMDRLKNE